jgi:hypothetical protein
MPEQIPTASAAPPGGAGKFSDSGRPIARDAELGDAPAPGSSKPVDETLAKIHGALGEHKGKLAIGVAATLGLMVFYKWREKKLAKEDPQEYARLQRFKNSVRADDNGGHPTAPPRRK